MRKLWAALAALITLSLTGCGYNTLQSNDEQIKASWSEVLNQYQRRADLVPNLVKTVQGFAAQERDVLLGVTNARAKVGSIQATPATAPPVTSAPGNLPNIARSAPPSTSARTKMTGTYCCISAMPPTAFPLRSGNGSPSTTRMTLILVHDLGPARLYLFVVAL